MKKKRGPFRTGFWFGGGFLLGAHLIMWLMDGVGTMAIMLFGIIMKGLGFDPGMFK